MKNKKAVSEMISYVLLIVIAVVLSVMVYAYIKVYIPKSQPTCQEDISLILNDYSCNISRAQLFVSITNKGLFKVDGAYIRLGNSQFKKQVNEDNFYFYEGNTTGLNPGSTYPRSYKISDFASGSYNLEIVPIDFMENKVIICEKAVISQPIECS